MPLGYSGIAQYAIADGPGVPRPLAALAMVASAPVLAKPLLGSHYNFAAPTWNVSSPVISTPLFRTVTPVHATPFAASSPAPATPALGGTQHLSALPFIGPSPVLAKPTVLQTHLLIALPTIPMAPQIGKALMNYRYGLAAASWSLGAPVLAAPVISKIDYKLIAQPFANSSPRMAIPRLGQIAAVRPKPFYRTAVDEAVALLDGVLDSLLATVPNQNGRQAAALRRLVGDMRDKGGEYIRSHALGAPLLACFDAALDGGAEADRMAALRRKVYTETPRGGFAAAVVEASILFSLIEESRIISRLTFLSQDGAQSALDRMVDAFEQAKLSDALEPETARAINDLAAAVTYHLANVQLQLPRVVPLSYQSNMPALTIAHRVYQDASRWEEIADENRTFNPMFMQRDIQVLSE